MGQQSWSNVMFKSHEIHGTGIFAYIWFTFMGHAVVNIPYMDQMGMQWNPKLDIWKICLPNCSKWCLFQVLC